MTNIYFQSLGLNNFDAFFTAEQPIFIHHIPLSDDNGRLMLDTPENHRQVWAGICITSVADGALAWEFTKHLINAYTNPVGRAAVEPMWGAPAVWGNRSFATPILRSLFREHAMRSFVTTYEIFGNNPFGSMQKFIGLDDEENRARQFENAIDRIAAYNEQPMGMRSPMIPSRLYQEHFKQFQSGIINAETAAQRMHNAISLWLIE